MELVSVNVAVPVPLERGDRVEVTAIDKRPTESSVEVGELGLAGDEVGDEANHGGVDQAVYVYSTDDLAYWEDELGRALRPGAFGENLTVSGVSTTDVAVGDRLRVGPDVVLEATAPRVPCSTFAHQMQEPRWVKRFAEAGLTGAYCRVITPGRVQAGQRVDHLPTEDRSLGIVDLLRLHMDAHASPEELRAALRHPLAVRARTSIEGRLGLT